jgi:hypothetical protein
MDTLKRGQISVSKKDLLYLIAVIDSVEKNMDVVMHEKESFERGKKIAKEMNRLTFQRHAFQHFQLNIPLKKLK